MIGCEFFSQATILATRKDIAETSDEKLLGNIPGRISAGSKPFLQSISAFRKCFQSLPACVSLTKFAPSILPQNCSVLIGLNGQDFSWEVEKFILRCQEAGAAYASTNTSKLTSEYGEGGMNESFRTIILSSSCVLGRAPKEWEAVFSSVGINNTVGMSVGNLECNVGGPEHSCSKMAAKVEYLPTTFGKYQFMACNDDDIVTLNGRRIIASMGPFPLRNRDICSVGPRVFVFIHKYRSK